MNEPIINPWVFYWLDVLNNINVCVIPIFAFSMLFTIIFGYEYLDSTEKTDSRFYNVQYYSNKAEQSKIKAKIFAIVALASMTLLIFVPSSKTVAKMLIAQQITQHNLNVAGDTVEMVIDKAVEKIIKARMDK